MNDEAGSSSAVPSGAQPRASQETSAEAASAVLDEAPSFYFSRKPRLQEVIVLLDRVVWLEIAVIYFLDNSFIRFALRSMIQAVYLMPKPVEFPEQSLPQPYIGGVLGVNIICMLFHLFSRAPGAGEATRGYLHGSLLLDFIGQHGPSSRLLLLLLDMVILLLQLLALAVISERKELESKKEVASQITSIVDSHNQDHDAEERGQVRGTTLGTDDIELDDLGDSRTATTMHESEPPVQNHTFALSDNIASGQAIIGDFHIVDSARSMYRAYEDRRREQNATDAQVADGGLAAMHGLRQRLTEQLQTRATG